MSELKITANAEINLRPSKIIYYSIVFNFLYFIAVADITSASIVGGNVRLAWLMLPFIYLLLPKIPVPKIWLLFTLAFFAIHFSASMVSGYILKGLIYSVWVLFNYIFFFKAAYSIGILLKSRLWNAILWGGRLQIVCGILMVVVGINERAQFIYFEPSYLAIGLVPYIFTAIFWGNKQLFDGCLILLLIAFNHSANLIIAILVGFLIWLISSKNIYKSIGLVLIIIFSILILYSAALVNPENPNHAVASWLHENGISWDLMSTVLSRGGNRVPRILAAWDMLENNWLIGFGPGGVYSDYIANIDFQHITGGVDYLDPAGLPVVNVIIEAATNAGILASLFLLVPYIYLLYFSYGHIVNRNERLIVFGALAAIGVMLQFESSYLRAYIWITFGAFASVSMRRYL